MGACMSNFRRSIVLFALLVAVATHGADLPREGWVEYGFPADARGALRKHLHDSGTRGDVPGGSATSAPLRECGARTPRVR